MAFLVFYNSMPWFPPPTLSNQIFVHKTLGNFFKIFFEVWSTGLKIKKKKYLKVYPEFGVIISILKILKSLVLNYKTIYVRYLKVKS